MNKIDVFVQNNVPQHLAVNSERLNEDKSFRSVCGNPTLKMEVKQVELPIVLSCKDCQWQLETWIKKSNCEEL